MENNFSEALAKTAKLMLGNTGLIHSPKIFYAPKEFLKYITIEELTNLAKKHGYKEVKIVGDDE